MSYKLISSYHIKRWFRSIYTNAKFMEKIYEHK